MKFLVAGGGGYFGSSLVQELKQRNHIVYVAQRSALKTEDIEFNLEYWKKIDFEDPSDVVTLIQDFVGDPLDGIAFFQKHDLVISINNVGPFDIEHTIRVNVLCPLMLIRYMMQFNGLKENARILIPLDKSTSEHNRVAYKISKAILTTVFEYGLDDIANKLNYYYVVLGKKSDELIFKLADLLTGEIEVKNKMLDYRKL